MSDAADLSPTPDRIEDPSPAPDTGPVPAPSGGRTGARSGRVKTRLLGFGAAQGATPDPFDTAAAQPPAHHASFPVGWLVVVDGPGRGAAFTIFDGVTQIGRGPSQAVRLDFGDNSISRGKSCRDRL